MADQLFSAALSVSSNIAEGNGRVHRRDTLITSRCRVGRCSRWNQSSTSLYGAPT
jgi:hypothetical protein